MIVRCTVRCTVACKAALWSHVDALTTAMLYPPWRHAIPTMAPPWRRRRSAGRCRPRREG
eukprot:scaffold89131_cov39-Phaeocystis_antarctica.AAC.1